MPRFQQIAVCLLAVFGLARVASPAAEPSPFADHPVNRWVKQSPREGKPVPKFGWEGSGAYDPFDKLWIHHAGHDGIPQGFVTFTFDPASGAWRQRFPPTSPPGVCCVDGANVFDTANRVFVRFPGGSLGHGYQWSRGVKLKESPVWNYDVAANRWTNMRPPPYADASRTRDAIGGLNGAGAYDPVHELAISFGGIGSAGGKNNLHVYDAYANRLYLIKPAAKGDPWPPQRDGCGLAYDAHHDKLVLFGGQYTNDEKTWVYDLRTNQWAAHDLTPHPPARKDDNTYSTIPKMTYDPVNKVLLCVVWLDERRGHETWVLDLETMTWQNTNAPTQPEHSKSRSRNLDFSAADNVAFLETWSVNSEPQIWTYRYKTASGGAKPLGRPQNLTATTDARSVKLAWDPVPGAKSYRVYRGEAAEPWKVAFERLADSTRSAWEDGSVTSGHAYTYSVRAVAADGSEGSPGVRARAQPRVAIKPVVSVLTKDRVEVSWNAHPAPDVAGYNVYRGVASPRTVKKGTPAAWKDNDPEYAVTVVTGVNDITGLVKLNNTPIDQTTFEDDIDLAQNPAPGYRYAVYAYIIKAVNRLGVESGPSPYALTIPSEPTNVLCRENAQDAELKWSRNPEKGVAGYNVYKLEGGVFGVKRVTDSPIRQTSFTHHGGNETTRYWVVAVDALGQEGQPSSPAWIGRSYKGFFDGEWHQ
ncbi:MAG TPA: kelch repeat-containing protein [Tepidisphaeraceae bacterium]|jgi:fibronectin type 3 domain-containing protein